MRSSLGLLLRVTALISVWAGTGGVGSAQEPLFEQTDVFVAGQDGVTEYRIPVLVTANNGTLLALCDARVDRPGDAPNNIDLVMKRSLDGGRTWGPLKRLANPGKGAAADSCAVVDRHTGTVWVFFGYYPEGIGSRNAQRGLYGPTVMIWSRQERRPRRNLVEAARCDRHGQETGLGGRALPARVRVSRRGADD